MFRDIMPVVGSSGVEQVSTGALKARRQPWAQRGKYWSPSKPARAVALLAESSHTNDLITPGDMVM